MENKKQPIEDTERSTKDRLMRAAVEVFAAKGFLAATVREICQAAGTNVAAVNYHFGDKEKLYAAVLWQVFSDHQRVKDFSGADGDGLKPEERLAELIRAEVRYLYQDKSQKECSGQHFSLFLMEMAHPSPFLGEVVERFIRPDQEKMLSLLRDLLGPETPGAVLERCSDSLWGQILHHIFIWPIDAHLNPGRPHPSQDTDELAEHIITITQGGLAALKVQMDEQRKSS